ncbi:MULTISPECIES: arginase family protein [Chryseobacterium]|uniref:Arginase n=1 Tax=Chryseobacterium camelliae TaxID=1265445 RepID=A0ABU0TJL8_9FLAO|nr:MULTISPECIES: arginase family protein [Chryseobacterium]MDT3405784.1 arginase [Pseudacidovorax intermedius]MDQ1096408.1 arginase [Chryseobacterium camelliae]MDQ1100349.1 arginase [Chryseobacterium sp. SORGH_AS_1048]MDR6087690.1 arginase [Chryseobacterium sp. SORGH_AS_0909]MDR6132065.1 arginase [Chryseobacterium sp. SORGH_AS_1175]
MKKDINIFEFPFNLGLTKKEHETEPGVKKLPDWFRKFGFHKRINPKNIFRLEAPEYRMDFDEETGVKNTYQVIEYAKKQSELILKHFNTDTFHLMLGGDCSILIGSALALKQLGNFGLFYLDGHTDYILPKLSPSGGIAGMDLAIASGLGHQKLTNINDLKPYFQEEHIFCVGNAETDDDQYVGEILNSKIHYLDLENLRRNGFRKTTEDFLRMVDEKNLDGFFIHFDVDVLKDEIMPVVDSRMEDGIDYENLKEILKPLIVDKRCFGLEITILDPDYDKEGIYTQPFIENLIQIINEPTKRI